MSTVQVFLDNYDSYCYPGQTIAGRVECVFNKEKNLRAIRVKFKGRAETEWTESESHYNSSTKKHESKRVRYHAYEEYFNAEYNLVQGGEGFHLPPGKHTYPFSYILPAHLPSSFEGTYGNIRYYVKAIVDRPWKFDYEHVFGLNMITPLDLNYMPGVREPVAISVDKTMCSCWCNDSGALTLELSLPASGFVPGQEVNIGAHVENMTNVNAEDVKFKIVADIKFITHHPRTHYKYDERELVACREGGIGAHGDKSWTSSLTIPSESFPNLLPCSIINMSYSLKAKVIVPCPHTNLSTTIPITIGTVALTGISTTFPGGPPSGLGLTTEGTPLLTNPYPGDAPPYPSGVGASYPSDINGFEEVKTFAPSPGGIPYSSGVPPYPSGGQPYPSGGPPYPSGGPPYPSGGLPYPSGGPPYPSGGLPYPSGSTSYPPPNTNGVGEKSVIGMPYPPDSADMKNPSGLNDTNPSAPSASNVYPSAPGFASSAPPAPGSAPYPTSNINAPPSYDEAKQQKEKNEKSE